MAKIFISLLIIASFGGIVASFAETAHPGSPLYSFKTGVNDNVASALCSVHLPCGNE
jgi:hypothetical protein